MSECKFRYDTSGTWYKGNTHIHSTRSDGGKDHAELAAMYAAAGYDFLVATDHWVASDFDSDDGDYPLLWLDGIELDGHDDRGGYFHVVCLGRFTGLAKEMGFPAAMRSAREQGGLMILAHPHWCGNTTDDALAWGFHGVETYNHVCRWINGKGDGSVYWNMCLAHRPNTLGFAVDDSHIQGTHPVWNGGWIMVNAPAATREAIMAAIWAGNFYATRGPRIHSITCDGAAVSLTSSEVRYIRLVGASSAGVRIVAAEGESLTAATFEIPAEWPYAYLEIEDDRGLRARTNSLMTVDD